MQTLWVWLVEGEMEHVCEVCTIGNSGLREDHLQPQIRKDAKQSYGD